MRNRDRVYFVHIPKTGGTYVLNVLFDKGSLVAEHYKLVASDVGARQVASCIRNPFDWYESVYHFFRNPPHSIENPFRRIVAGYDDIDRFVRDLINRDLPVDGVPLAPMDSYFLSSANELGMLSNYLLYFFDFRGESEAEAASFIRALPARYVFFRQETLTADLVAFAQRIGVELNEGLLSTRINTTVRTQSLGPDTRRLVRERDTTVFEAFYADDGVHPS